MEETIKFLKILSDPTRLRIISLLSQRELCVCELCKITSESQPKISRHLAKLKDATFVVDRRVGQWVFYSLNIKNQTQLNILSVMIKTLKNQMPIKKDFAVLNEFIKLNKFCIKK